MMALEPGLIASIGFAVTAGVITFFSPCAYPLLPGYVGFYVSQTATGAGQSLGGTVVRGTVAATGVLATFGALFLGTLWVGYATLENVELFEPIVGVVLLGFGILIVLGRAPSLSIALPKRRASVLGFGIFGAGFALAAAGCVAPVFIGVVGLALSQPITGTAVILGSYVGTVAVLMLGVTIATGMGLLAGADRIARHTQLLERIAGGVMIVAGLGQLYLAIFILDVL